MKLSQSSETVTDRDALHGAKSTFKTSSHWETMATTRKRWCVCVSGHFWATLVPCHVSVRKTPSLGFGLINGTQSAVGRDRTRDPVNTPADQPDIKDRHTERHLYWQTERRCLLATEGNEPRAAATATGSIKANSWCASALPVTINIQPYTVTHTGNIWHGGEHFCLAACLHDGHRMHQNVSLIST